MLIGIPKEIKDHEYRVGLTPTAVHTLIREGHEVWVQKDAGSRVGFSDDQYEARGAKIVPDAKTVYEAEMIIKVKEVQTEEYPLLKEGQILFGFLHLAPDPEQTEALIKQKVVAIAFETITNECGRLPLLVPMSEIAGRISVQVGAHSLLMANGGKGVLLGGAHGVLPGRVCIIGAGVSGTEAARMALGLGADVTILDRNLTRLQELDLRFGPRLKTLYSTPETIEEVLPQSDLVIGAVLNAGEKAPCVVSRALVQQMESGSAIVDISIDQGGCIETSRPTTHSNPMYTDEGVVHYCVTNMPGACARSATFALTNAILPYAERLASQGWREATKDPHMEAGVNTCLGHVTNEPIAHELGYTYVPLEKLVQSGTLESIGYTCRQQSNPATL